MKPYGLALGAVALALAASGTALSAPPGSQGNQGGHGDHANHGEHSQAGQGQSNARKPKPPQANQGKKYSGQACPPGLAKKNPGCVPPGQWKKGDRLPESWAGHYSAYGSLPQIFRNRYANRADRRYVYQNDRLFVIDAATRVVVDILTR